MKTFAADCLFLLAVCVFWWLVTHIVLRVVLGPLTYPTGWEVFFR